MDKMTNYTRTPDGLTRHTLEREGCTLTYWMGGNIERPMLVMLHGATMDHRMFNAQIEALQDDYQVLVWDARGHGESQPNTAEISLELFADDMVAILNQHKIDRFVPIGQSLGGYVAQHLYMRVPNRIPAMVIIGSTPIAKAYHWLEVAALKVSLPIFDWMPYGLFTNMVARNTALTQPVRDYALDAARQIPKDEFSRIWKAVTLAIDTDGRPNFKLDVPLLLVHGDHDRTGTIKRDMPQWAQTASQAAYHVIPDAGHNANQDNPTVTNDLLRTFLQTHVG